MSASLPAVPISKVRLVDLTEDDLTELAGFVAAQSGRALDQTLSHLAWLLLENPARHELVPLGCGVRSSSGALAGCILYLPQMFVLGRSPFLVLGSSCFYVDESYRGSGGALFLKFSRAANQWPLFGNSANAIAAQLWKARGANPIPHSDYELLGVVHWPPVVEELAVRRGAGKSSSQAIGSASAWLRHVRRLKLPYDRDCELVRLSSVEEVMELPLGESSDSITALRNEAYIRWRYCSGSDPSISLFAFRKRQSHTGVFVAVNERPRGHRGQILSLNVLDVFPKQDADTMVAIVAALYETYLNRTHMIVLRCLDVPGQQAFIQAGFLRREFELPNGWLLDRRVQPPIQDWYFVPADGDWII